MEVPHLQLYCICVGILAVSLDLSCLCALSRISKVSHKSKNEKVPCRALAQKMKRTPFTVLNPSYSACLELMRTVG